MELKKKKILLWTKGRKQAVSAVEDDYNLVRDLILRLLKKEKEMVLTELIEQAHIHLGNQISGDLGWYVLNVKQDMELKGLIKTKQGLRHQPFPVIKLKRRIASL